MRFSADFVTSSVMGTDNRLKSTFALSITLLFGAVTLDSRQATPGQPQNPAACLLYEPAVVQLNGTIIRETFPGPPNYKSVERGYKPEEAWLLALSQPICMEQDRKDPDQNPAQKDVQRIQLVFRDATPHEGQKGLVGKKVVARGMLFGAHAGHHHTPVLLTVIALTKVG